MAKLLENISAEEAIKLSKDLQRQKPESFMIPTGTPRKGSGIYNRDHCECHCDQCDSCDCYGCYS